MRLLHAVTGKLKSFNVLATACNSRSGILSHVACFLSRRVNVPLGLGSGFDLGNIDLMRGSLEQYGSPPYKYPLITQWQRNAVSVCL